MIDCFEQQLAAMTTPLTSVSVSEPVETVATSGGALVDVDPIVAVLEQAGIGEADDPLAAIMKTKVVEQQKEH